MDKKIIYLRDEGNVALIVPANCGLTIEEIAQKDVPTGVKYKIIDDSELPSDGEFFEAWEYDFDKHGHDGVGS